MSDSWHQNLRSKNRKEIIAAGRKLFLKNNFLNVNIKDVCTLAEVSRVTFYKHFKSIDELIFQVQIDILNNMTDYIIERDNTESSGIERIKMVLHAWVEFAKEFRDQIKFIVLFDSYYDSNEKINLMYENFINQENDKDFLHSIIEKGIEDKSFREGLDPIKTEYYIYQTITGVLQRMSYTKLPNKYGTVSFDDIALSVINMIVKFLSDN